MLSKQSGTQCRRTRELEVILISRKDAKEPRRQERREGQEGAQEEGQEGAQGDRRGRLPPHGAAQTG